MTSNNDKPLVKLIKTEKKDMTKYQKLIFRHNRYCTYEEIIRACYEKYHSSKFQTQMQWAKFLEINITDTNSKTGKTHRPIAVRKIELSKPICAQKS